MTDYLHAIGDAIVDRSAQELISALMMALGLSLVVSGLYALGRRRVGDPVMLVTCLSLVASVAAMALSAGYLVDLRRRHQRDVGGSRTVDRHHTPAFLMDDLLARRILRMADGDGDGLLSADEAARAATLFVERANARSRRPLDAPSLAGSIQYNIWQVYSEAFASPLPPPPPGERASRSPEPIEVGRAGPGG